MIYFVTEIKYKFLFFFYVFFISGCTFLPKNYYCNRIPYDVLYHGSNRTDIKELLPKRGHYRDISEGANIFATPSIAVASCYLFRWNDSWVRQKVLHSEEDAPSQVLMIINRQKYIHEQDKGGSIYILPPDSFEFMPEKGLGIYEAISSTAVKPYTKIDFDSALNAMTTFNVDVYFVDDIQFKYISSISSAHWLTYLDKQSIKPWKF